MVAVLEMVGVGLALITLTAAIVGIFASRGGRYWFGVVVLFVSAFASCTIAARSRHSSPLSPYPFPEAATRFEEFPVYWLGEEYRGLPLTIVHEPLPGSTQRSIQLGYGGSCRSRSLEGSCTAAIYVEILPIGTSTSGSVRPSGTYYRNCDVLVHVSGKGPPALGDFSLANPAFFSPEPLVDVATFGTPC